MEIREKRMEQTGVPIRNQRKRTVLFLHSSGLWLLFGGVLTVLLGISDALFLSQPPSPGFLIHQILVVISHIMVLIGLIGGLAGSNAGGKRLLARIGMGILLLGGTLFIPSEIILMINLPLGRTLDGVSALLMAVGFTLTGIAVLLTHSWQSWHRFTPLSSGLYIFLILLPIMAVTVGPLLFLALGCWGVPLLLLGVSLRIEGKRNEKDE